MTIQEMLDKIRADAPNAEIDADDIRRWNEEANRYFERNASAFEKFIVEHAAEMARQAKRKPPGPRG